MLNHRGEGEGEGEGAYKNFKPMRTDLRQYALPTDLHGPPAAAMMQHHDT